MSNFHGYETGIFLAYSVLDFVSLIFFDFFNNYHPTTDISTLKNLVVSLGIRYTPNPISIPNTY